MLSSLKTLTLALVVTGMEIPAHDVEDHDGSLSETHAKLGHGRKTVCENCDSSCASCNAECDSCGNCADEAEQCECWGDYWCEDGTCGTYDDCTAKGGGSLSETHAKLGHGRKTVVTGMEIPAHDVEDHDDLREEEHEAAFVEEEAAGHSEASVAALEAKIREQVAAIAATHREIEALRAEMAQGECIAGIEFVSGPGNIGANGDQGCIQVNLAGFGMCDTEKIQLKLYQGDSWDVIKNFMGGGTSAVGTWEIDKPEATSYFLFAPGAERDGMGGCPQDNSGLPNLDFFYSKKLANPFGNPQKYCVAIEYLQEDEGFKMKYSYTAKSFACFEVSCTDGSSAGTGMPCNTNLGSSSHWTTTVGTISSLGLTN